MNNEFWGYHLILDCAGGEVSRVSNAEVIKEFVKELVPAIDMKAYGDPVVVHFASHSEKAAGYSLVQLIETSAITGHFSDSTGDFYIDIFSCKTFDDLIAQEIVKKYFNPASTRFTFLIRQA